MCRFQIGSGSRVETRSTIDTEFCHIAALEELTEGSYRPASKRVRRANTLEEKRSMRRARKKRQQRYAMGAMELRKKISEQEDQLRDSERKGITYRCMAKTYWERWRYELEEWKKDVAKQREFRFKMRYFVKSPGVASSSSSIPTLPLIDRSMLTNPTQYGSNARD